MTLGGCSPEILVELPWDFGRQGEILRPSRERNNALTNAIIRLRGMLVHLGPKRQPLPIRLSPGLREVYRSDDWG